MKPFRASRYNFAPCALETIDATKSRGVVALRPIREGDVIALFPGKQTVRIPADAGALLPMRAWARRPGRGVCGGAHCAVQAFPWVLKTDARAPFPTPGYRIYDGSSRHSPRMVMTSAVEN